MKVTQLKGTQLTFNANYLNDDNVLGYDDEISKSRREFIRDHYYTYKMPYQSIYETEGRLSEYQLNNLIKTLNNKPRQVDYSLVRGLPIPNIRPIGNNSYRGEQWLTSRSVYKH